MIKEKKGQIIEDLANRLSESSVIYLADISGLNAALTFDLRKSCFKQGIKMSVVKNTFLEKAMEKSNKDFSEFLSVLKGNTSIFYSSVPNAPAKVIQSILKKSKIGKPLFKAACVNDDVYIGADHLITLLEIKSKEELIGSIIDLLQSPARRLLSALLSKEREDKKEDSDKSSENKE